ncbi:MAG: hypothetical protein JSU74_05660 [Candidatus Zixiibacteriota bacterium]|nr:MAG: hypothetical protein JSU74_05660 [candidate division Zixibacteria bacterium]
MRKDKQYLARWALTAVLMILPVQGQTERLDQDVFRRTYLLGEGIDKVGDKSRSMTVMVQQDRNGGIEPSLAVELWQGECRMGVVLKNKQAPSDPSMRLRSLAGDTTALVTSSGTQGKLFPTENGFEWEIVLAKRPDTNVLRYDLHVEGLNFFRQDSLTNLERYSLGARRPDSLIGAYVAYHSARCHNRRLVNGDDTVHHDYGTGQAFVIYRPRAWDDRDTVWCDLMIDTDQGFMQVSVDADWLRSASYPVTIDPTFGNTSVGASTMDWNMVYAYCHYLTGSNTYIVPAGKTATIDQYTVYGSETGAGDLTVTMVAFRIQDGYPDVRVSSPAAVNISGGTAGWFSSGAVNHELTEGTEYGTALSCAPRSGGTLYYNSVANTAVTDNTNCGLDSENWTLSTETGFNLSMYATYTEAAAAPKPLYRRRRAAVSGNSGGGN